MTMHMTTRNYKVGKQYTRKSSLTKYDFFFINSYNLTVPDFLVSKQYLCIFFFFT